MKIVGPRLGDDVHLGAGIPAKRSVNLAGLNLELLNSVRIGDGRTARIAGIALLKIVGVDTVDHEVIVVGSTAIDAGPRSRHPSAAPSELAGVGHIDSNSRGQADNLGEVPIYQLKAGNNIFSHHTSERAA